MTVSLIKKHSDNLKKKAMKRLNLIKRLAAINWGSDKNTLRGLYLGYARAIFNYNLVLQRLCNNAITDLVTLFKTTPCV